MASRHEREPVYRESGDEHRLRSIPEWFRRWQHEHEDERDERSRQR